MEATTVVFDTCGPKWLSRQEAAALLGCGRGIVVQLAADRCLRWRHSEDHLIEVLARDVWALARNLANEPNAGGQGVRVRPDADRTNAS